MNAVNNYHPESVSKAEMVTQNLLDIFHAHQGIVCFVGAGGKKTTMYRLACEHQGRIAITATSHIEFFPKKLEATRYIGGEKELLKLVAEDTHSSVIAFAQPSRRRGRRAGISLDLVDSFRISGRFDLLLIKADGARSRLLKCPAVHEPPLPECANTVITVISAKPIGKPLTDKIAHRVERISRVAGLDENENIEPVHIARILASREGALKNTGRAKVIPLINMVDDKEREILAREAARTSLDLTDRFDHVVLGAMRSGNPVIDVITR